MELERLAFLGCAQAEILSTPDGPFWPAKMASPGSHGASPGSHRPSPGASSGPNSAQKRLRAPGPVAFTGIMVALGPECFAVSPADPRFNPDFVDEALAEVLAHEEGHPVSVQQIISQVQGDLVLVTLIDAAGPSAISSKSLSQTLMIQALNPKSQLRRRSLGTPLREQSAMRSHLVASPSDADRPAQQTRFSERDIAAFALCNMAKEQQRLVEQMGQEIKILQQGLSPHAQGPRRSVSPPPPQDGIDAVRIESKLDELRELTLRQTQERNAVIANLEDVLVRFVCVFMTHGASAELLLVLPDFCLSDASGNARGCKQRQNAQKRGISPPPSGNYHHSPPPEGGSISSRVFLPEVSSVPVSCDPLWSQPPADRTLFAQASAGPHMQSEWSPMHSALASASPGAAWQREGHTRPSWQPLLPHKSESGPLFFVRRDCRRVLAI